MLCYMNRPHGSHSISSFCHPTITMPLNLDYQANTYIAVTVTAGSEYVTSPSSLANIHPALSYVGKVGELDDVQLLAVPKPQWESESESILSYLKGKNGINGVDVQELRQRVKRGGDEL
jgi:hypothetical protein